MSASDTVVQGVVAAVGADPFAQVVVSWSEGGAVREVAVLGALRSEVAALQGAVVRVQGRAVVNAQPWPLRAVEASSYEIVSINGEKPVVGELVAGEGALWLTGQQVLDAPPELQQAVGAKVWIVGRSTTDGIRVRSYGIIARQRR